MKMALSFAHSFRKGSIVYAAYLCSLHNRNGDILVAKAYEKTTRKKIHISSRSLKITPEEYDVNQSRFSESMAFHSRQRDFWQKHQQKLRMAPKPNLGDYYDTFKYRAYERRSIIASLVTFMIYFFILREENDIDADLYKPLYLSVPALERQVLEEKIARVAAKGESTEELEDRLEVILTKTVEAREKLKDKKIKPPWRMKIISDQK